MPSRHRHLRVLATRAAGLTSAGRFKQAAEVSRELAVATAEQQLRDLDTAGQLTDTDRRRLMAVIDGPSS
jgi:hypothetical protein